MIFIPVCPERRNDIMPGTRDRPRSRRQETFRRSRVYFSDAAREAGHEARAGRRPGGGGGGPQDDK